MGARRFAVVDERGMVANVVMYDPDDEYDPGEGLALVELADDHRAEPGDTLDKHGRIVAKGEPVAAVDEADPVAQLVATLVAKKVLTAADAAKLDEVRDE